MSPDFLGLVGLLDQMLDFALYNMDIEGKSVLTLGENPVPLKHHPLHL